MLMRLCTAHSLSWVVGYGSGPVVTKPSFVRVFTESAVDDLWMYFRRFEVIDQVRGRTATVESDANAEAVVHCVRQAREYYRSARTAPLLTRPVLLYYGMVSLGKLLLLLDEHNPVEMDEVEQFERRGHRLGEIDPDATSTGVYQLEEARIEVSGDVRRSGERIGRGIFPQLAERVCPTRGRRWIGEQFAVRDVLRAIPQLDLQLRQAFGQEQGYTGVGVSPASFSDGTDALRVVANESAPQSAADVYARAPYLSPDQYPVEPGDSFYPLQIRVPAPARLYEFVAREELSPFSYVLPPVMLGERLDGLLAQYMAMYALSIVARYKPHRWATILEGRHSALLPVLEKLMAVSERWWPNLVLNRLTGTTVLFAALPITVRRRRRVRPVEITHVQ